MSWESTTLYYEVINQVVGRELGGLHSAEILLASVDFHAVEALQSANRWIEAGELLARRARTLEAGGADVLVLCTNTMHKVAERIEAEVSVPLLHIAEATGRAIERLGIRYVGLLGTRFTMEESFYRDRLQDRYGLAVLTPPVEDRELVDRVIYQELCRGRVLETSRDQFMTFIEALVLRGCQGVILGCTEIGLLVRAADVSVPVFDTARLHAEAAARVALSDESG